LVTSVGAEPIIAARSASSAIAGAIGIDSGGEAGGYCADLSKLRAADG
jgi:hypothetical protein